MMVEEIPGADFSPIASARRCAAQVRENFPPESSQLAWRNVRGASEKNRVSIRARPAGFNLAGPGSGTPDVSRAELKGARA